MVPNLRNLVFTLINSEVNSSIESVYLGAKIWYIIPENITFSESFLKVKLKKGYQKFVHANYARNTSISLVL